ncbi:MAG: class I SAM-dependent methyltransferase [Gammaproteobacteria bacterium]|nr:class I SAM-dependent methyltransferase [Gammaproteobacteria bacterium]
MKNLIPWWFKIFAKIILSRIPVGYGIWQRVGVFRHGYMDQASYVLNVFNEHVSRSGLDGKIQGKTILEIGPGDSIATALVAACYGANAILLDAGSFATTDIEQYRKLAKGLKSKGLNVPDISKAETLDEMLAVCGGRYLTQGLASFSSIETGAVDLIFSQAVLEHVRKHEFVKTMQECFRVLTLKGVVSHRVDLKDHLGGSLNNLRFNERIWESEFFVRSGFYTNRIRFSEMINMFEEVKFMVEVCDVRRWQCLPIKRQSLADDFNYFSDNELMVSGFDVLMHK